MTNTIYLRLPNYVLLTYFHTEKKSLFDLDVVVNASTSSRDLFSLLRSLSLLFRDFYLCF